jgi:hypothetical protein
VANLDSDRLRHMPGFESIESLPTQYHTLYDMTCVPGPHQTASMGGHMFDGVNVHDPVLEEARELHVPDECLREMERSPKYRHVMNSGEMVSAVAGDL